MASLRDSISSWQFEIMVKENCKNVSLLKVERSRQIVEVLSG
jgi:hypothetical protein